MKSGTLEDSRYAEVRSLLSWAGSLCGSWAWFLTLVVACGPGAITSPPEMARRASASKHSHATTAAAGLAASSQKSLASSSISCGASGPNQDPCTYTVTQVDANTTQYVISQPVVDEIEGHEYPDITFQAGDQITISAGGCVQTGGTGPSTWKRYVDPTAGDNLYYGTITIRGAVYVTGSSAFGGGATSLEPVDNKPLSLFSGINLGNGIATLYVQDIPSPTDLILGYIDDSYSDNGYYDHDDGTGGQCSSTTGDGGPAHVTITVTHGPVSAIPNPNPFNFDIVQRFAADYDNNLLYLGPEWGWQKQGLALGDPRSNFVYPGDAPQTGQTTSTDVRTDWPNTIGCGEFPRGAPGQLFARGHVNWSDVTYTGSIYWDDYSSNDDDANLRLGTPVAECPLGVCDYPSGIAEGNVVDSEFLYPNGPPAVLLEFNSTEAVFDIGDWSTFADGEFGGNGVDLHQVLDGHDAVAVGLMGLDVEHAGHSELHPVHAIGMDVSCSSGIQKWMIFIRNWGTEGFCSQLDHWLELRDVVLDLPRPKGVGNNYVPTVNLAKSSLYGFGNVGGTVNFYLDPSGPTSVQVHLGDPATHPIVFGTLEVDWGLPTQVPSSCPTGASVASRALAQTLVDEDASSSGMSEDDNELFVGLGIDETPTNANDFRVLMRTLTPKRPVAFTPQSLVQSVNPFVRPSQSPMVASAYSQTAHDQGLAALDGACIVAGGNTPNAPNACSKMPPLTQLTTSGGATGQAGWLVSPLVATFSVRDASGAGIDRTEYGFDGTNWSTYRGPFVLPDGIVTLFYRSIDRAGNVENIRWSNAFKIDTRSPVTLASLASTPTGLDLTYQVSDPSPGSGAAGLYYKLHDDPEVHFVSGASGVVHLNSSCSDVDYWGVDVAGNMQTPHGRFFDVTPPELTVAPTSVCLWPPNHDLVAFRLGRDLAVSARDACDPSPAVDIISIRSNEPTLTGDVSHDATSGCVRRARDGWGDGRTYTVTVRASDYSGNAANGTVQIKVPHDQADGACPNFGKVLPSHEACP
jgi:hypothetical protein